MSEVAKIEDYSGGLLSVIERASRDPAVDVDKLERLFALQERVLDRQAKIAFTEAKIAMRPELPEVTMKGMIVIKKDNRIIQETPFARFEDIHDVVMPILTAHGFDLKFKNGLSPDGKVRVTTILSHVGGHEESTDFDLPHDSSGSKNAVQAVGSSTSYGKRYGTISILNLKVAGEDDDGEASEERTSVERPADAPFPQGPARNKTELKKLGRELWAEIQNAEDQRHLDSLLDTNAALLKQLGVALPSWMTGGRDGQGEMYEGLNTVIERKRDAFAMVSAHNAG